jgi:N-acetylglucosaminyldiphosphoundecaprenol N-acetyl-beta-D-mannosaminyltransferase
MQPTSKVITPIPSNFLGYNLLDEPLANLFQPPSKLINTINQYSYCVAEEDIKFKESLTESDILLPDGIAIVAAVRFLTGKKIKKIAGADLHLYLLSELNEKDGTCFYLGASESTLKKIKHKMALEFPRIQVGTFSPPFKPIFTKEENQKMINAINKFQPDVLFVGMTAPKQEKWAFRHKEVVNAKVICTIGAVFDFYAGTVKRPNQFWISCGLEWLIRLAKEPRRLWKRYLYFGPKFIFLLIKEKVKLI